MSAVHIEKLAEDLYRVTNGEFSVEFNKEKFEDLYYAVPLNNTGFLRLLLDDVSQSDADRLQINKMLDATESRNQALKALQEQIQKMDKPD